MNVTLAYRGHSGVATDGRFEYFKTTPRFDSPIHRQQHDFRN